MKKILIIAICTLALASCDSKSCRCYSKVNSHWTGPSTTVTTAGTRCSDLNNATTKCNEMDDPILDPNDIAVDSKKKK